MESAPLEGACVCPTVLWGTRVHLVFSAAWQGSVSSSVWPRLGNRGSENPSNCTASQLIHGRGSTRTPPLGPSPHPFPPSKDLGLGVTVHIMETTPRKAARGQGRLSVSRFAALLRSHWRKAAQESLCVLPAWNSRRLLAADVLWVLSENPAGDLEGPCLTLLPARPCQNFPRTNSLAFTTRTSSPRTSAPQVGGAGPRLRST